MPWPRARFPETERLAPDVQVVIALPRAASGRRDWIAPVRYHAVIGSIRHTIILPSTGYGTPRAPVDSIHTVNVVRLPGGHGSKKPGGMWLPDRRMG